MVENTFSKTGTADVQKQRAGLLAFARKRVRLPEDAEDIIQNVFYQLAKADILLSPVENVSAWLFKAVRNQIIDFARKKKLTLFTDYFGADEDAEEGPAALASAALTPEAEQLRALFWEELSRSLADLPEEQRTVFEKTELQGISFKKLSQESGVAVSTLLSRKHYAVLHLRKCLRTWRADMLGLE